MILKGSQRGGAKQLAVHLLNNRDNDHVEVHSVSGFVGHDVTDAFMEMYAVSRATNATKFMFSLSLSPPKGETVMIEDFENAVEQAAERLGLPKQPRVVIFHEKQSRRHCHAVFCRIDLEQMKAINLPFFKQKLNALAKELYLSHGWDMPKGFSDKSLTNPSNFGLEEWQVAKRAKRDPREIKTVLKQCWTQSDGAAAFSSALKDRGFWLCRGSGRGFVALDYMGNTYSLSRWLDVKSKDLKARLGDPNQQLSVDDTKTEIDKVLSDSAKRLLEDTERQHAASMRPLREQRLRMVERQRREREEFLAMQSQRQNAELLERSKKFRKGILGIFDWITGKRKRVKNLIETEIRESKRRDEIERQLVIQRQLDERRSLQANIDRVNLYKEKQHQKIATVLLAPQNRQADFGSGAIDQEVQPQINWYTEHEHDS
jgi:Relaxase/Mobilisation nuclease domain